MNSSTKNKHIQRGIYLKRDNIERASAGYISIYTYNTCTKTLLYDDKNYPYKIYVPYMKLYNYNKEMTYQEIENLFS